MMRTWWSSTNLMTGVRRRSAVLDAEADVDELAVSRRLKLAVPVDDVVVLRSVLVPLGQSPTGSRRIDRPGRRETLRLFPAL